jgi:hypothetical protein
MAKIMKNRTDNDIKNKWNSMQRTEGRGEVSTSSSTSSNGRDGSAGFRSQFEASSWKSRAQHMMPSKNLFVQPFLTATTTPLHPSLLPLGLGTTPVVADIDNADTTVRIGQVDWENKMHFL